MKNRKRKKERNNKHDNKTVKIKQKIRNRKVFVAKHVSDTRRRKNRKTALNVMNTLKSL